MAAVSMAWPAVVFPFVGYFGSFSLVFIPLAMVLGFAVVVQAVLERERLVDLWVCCRMASGLFFCWCFVWLGTGFMETDFCFEVGSIVR